MKNKKYYYLQKGDIVKKGDEVYMSDSMKEDGKWVKAVGSIGKPAADPKYPAHCVYRRKIA